MFIASLKKEGQHLFYFLTDLEIGTQLSYQYRTH